MEYLETVRQEVMENLRTLESAPGVQLNELPPPDFCFSEEEEEEEDEDMEDEREAAKELRRDDME